MPKLICVSNQKGGVGKSTICLNLAYMFNSNLKVGILDFDLQGSLTEIFSEEPNIDIINPTTDVSSLYSLTYDLIFIDTPPYLSSRLPIVLSVADIVIVPVKAGVFDVMALQPMLSLIAEAVKSNPDLKSAILFNMVKSGSKLLSEMQAVVNNSEVPVLETIITDRVSYTRSLLTGGVLKSDDNKAKFEIMSLADEILKILGI